MAYTPEKRLQAMYAMEAVGSFVILIVIQMSHISSFSAFAISLSFLVSVVLCAKISGAHLNGAVTLMLALNQVRTEQAPYFQFEKVFKYILAQIVGGFCAGLVSAMIHDASSLADIHNTVSLSQAFALEFIFTMILCTVVSILCSDSYKQTHDPAIVGALVSASVFLASIALGDKTGGVINPSVGVSAILARAITNPSSNNFKVIWLYIAAPLSGGLGAHLLYHYVIRPAYRRQTSEIKRSILLSNI